MYMTSVVVFDYGFGNVRSMVRALMSLGLDVTLTSDHHQAVAADGLVVPGVGAFAACVQGLRDVGGDAVILERLSHDSPVLGVCVGEQIMFDSGIEHGVDEPGLGLIAGFVDHLDADVVPHMGWNTVEADSDSVLFSGIGDERFYFVHSFAALDIPERKELHLSKSFDKAPERIAWCTYGRSRFVAAYERGPLSATQFHPEKSAQAGLQLLRNWVNTFAITR